MRTLFSMSAENMSGNVRGCPETPVRRLQQAAIFCRISDRGQEEENGWQY